MAVLRSFLCLVCVDLAMSVSTVYILSNYNHQLLSSTCLRWSPASAVKENVVKVGEMAVCRARDGVKLLPGRTDGKQGCVVEERGRTRRERRYEVLLDRGGMARLEWRKWDMSSTLDQGTIVYTSHNQDNLFVARYRREDGSYMLGHLSLGRVLGGNIQGLIADNETEVVEEGEVLVEIEPVKYKLVNMKLIVGRSKSKKKEFRIGSTSLVRRGDSTVECLSQDVGYKYSSYSHWGYVDGTIRGLPAGVIFNDTHTQVFKWGLPTEEDRSSVWTVTASLLPDTGVNVTVTANLRRTQVPYIATLESVYKDQEVRHHRVSGMHTYTDVTDLREERSQPFLVSSGQPAAALCDEGTSTDCCNRVETTQTTQIQITTSTLDIKQIITEKIIPAESAEIPTSAQDKTTLFPPPPVTEAPPNPLKMFYPEEARSQEETLDETRAAPLLDNINNSSHSCTKLTNIFLLIVLSVFLSLKSGFIQEGNVI